MCKDTKFSTAKKLMIQIKFKFVAQKVLLDTFLPIILNDITENLLNLQQIIIFTCLITCNMKNSLLFRLVVLVTAMMCALGASAKEAYACYTSENKTFTFYYDNERIAASSCDQGSL